jgi:ribosome maturation factor RimP
MAASAEDIRAAVEPALASSGVEGVSLWDVELAGDTIRVMVDRPGGIDLDTLSRLERSVLSPLLDAHPELTPPGRYCLEVSSPGLERTLRRPEHFAAYLGRTVAVKTRVAVRGSRRWQGVLVSSDASGLILEPAGGEGPVSIPAGGIERARAVLEWGPAPKPGGGGAGRKRSDPAAKRPAAGGLGEVDLPVALTGREPE